MTAPSKITIVTKILAIASSLHTTQLVKPDRNQKLSAQTSLVKIETKMYIRERLTPLIKFGQRLRVDRFMWWPTTYIHTVPIL